MQMKKYLILFFGLIPLLGLAQKQSQNFSWDFLDFGQADSLIRKAHPELKLSSSYYIFLYPMVGAATTFAPQVIKEMRALNELGIRRSKEDILFIFMNEQGLNPQLIPNYLKEVLLLDEDALKSIKFIVNDQVYHALNQGELAKLLYIYRSKLVYKRPCKLYGILEKPVPHEIIDLEELPKLQISADSILLLGTDKLISYQTNRLLLQTDIKDALLELNPNTGKMGQSFSLKNYDPTEVYCQLFASDSAACAYARQHYPQLKQSNRQALNIYTIKYFDHKIYALVSIEAFEKLKHKYTYWNDEGVKKTKAKETPILSAFGAMMVLDTNFQVLELYRIDDKGSKAKFRLKYPGFDVGFFLSSPTELYTTNGYLLVLPFLSKRSIAKFTFSKERKEIRFAGNLKGKTSQKTQNKLAFQNLKTFFYSLDGNTYYSYDVYGDIYDLNTGKKASSFTGDGRPPYKKEVYRKFAEDDFEEKLNFEIHAIQPVFDGQFLAAVYKYQNRLILEIKTSSLETVDIIDLSQIPAFENYLSVPYKNNICINNNHLYYLSMDQGKYFLNTFKLNLN